MGVVHISGHALAFLATLSVEKQMIRGGLLACFFVIIAVLQLETNIRKEKCGACAPQSCCPVPRQGQAMECSGIHMWPLNMESVDIGTNYFYLLVSNAG